MEPGGTRVTTSQTIPVKTTLLSGLAAIWAMAGPARAEHFAEEFLRAASAAAARQSACPATADDLAAEVLFRFTKAYRDWAAAPDVSPAYLRRSVANVRAEWERRRGRAPVLTDLAGDDGEASPDAAVLDVPPSLPAQWGEFLASLSAEDVRVLELLDAGLSERAIAREIGESRRQVRASVRRLRLGAEKYLGDADD
jgi:DNA-directed RNA polymerase specialized sigma24 family protein